MLTHSLEKSHIICVKCNKSFYQATNLNNKEIPALPNMETVSFKEFDEKVKSFMKTEQNIRWNKKGRYLSDLWKGRTMGETKRPHRSKAFGRSFAPMQHLWKCIQIKKSIEESQMYE